MKINTASTSTKHKIFSAAKRCFAVYGFEGTSIRMISQEAKVNVAAIHYHFQSKENLYNQLVKKTYYDMAEVIKKLNKKFIKLDQFVLAIFRMYLEKSDDYLTTMKLLLSDAYTHELNIDDSDETMIGPPGGKSLYDAIKLQVQNPLCNDKDFYWAVKAIFSYMMQMTMVQTCCLKTLKQQRTQFSTQKDLEIGLIRLVKNVMNDLNTKN